MDSYYLNLRAQPNGDHEVHKAGCTYMPSTKKYLGTYSTCGEAVRDAKKTHRTANGCFYCSKHCHTS